MGWRARPRRHRHFEVGGAGGDQAAGRARSDDRLGDRQRALSAVRTRERRLDQCLFGFQIWEGFRSCQAPGQHVILADPGPDHLIELRRLIYPEVRASSLPTIGAATALGYRFEDQTHVRFEAHVPGAAAVQNLVAMTPHAFRLSKDGHARLTAIEQLTVTVDVVLRRLVLGSAGV